MSTEATSPKLAGGATASAVAVASATRNKGTTTEQINREQIFQCMTPLLPLPFPLGHSSFSMVLMLSGVLF